MQKRMSVAVVIVCLGVVFAFVAIAVQRARIAAWKMSSRNNLRQAALGLGDFESAFKRFPPGCDLEAKHGWMTGIQPFMEASPWYGKILLNRSWEDPSNRYKFRIRMHYWENPGVSDTVSEEGFGLTHYLANPALLHRNSRTRLSDLKSGTSHVWLAGEVSGRYQPFGYPFNWRPLSWPLSDGRGSYGGWPDGAQFCMADNSVRFVSSSIDRSVVDRMIEAMPMPDANLIDVPKREFKTKVHVPERRRLLFPNKEARPSKLSTESEIIFDEKGKPEIAVFVKTNDPSASQGITIETMLQSYPGIKVLDYRRVLDDNVAEQIAGFRELETLVTGDLNVTEVGIQKLASLEKLNSITFNDGDPAAIEAVKAALPDCDIQNRRYRLP